MRYKINSIIDQIEPEKIFDSEIFTQIKYQAGALIENQEKDGAAEFARGLQGLLGNVEPRSSRQTELFNVLFFWLYRLKIFAFSSLTFQEQLDIFKHEVTQFLVLKFDLIETVGDSLKILSGSDYFEKRIKDYLLALIDSDSVLGKFRDPKFNGSVKLWLQEYRENRAGKGSEMSDFGAFHILNFFNTNTHVKSLNAEEKEVLKSLFELFNWLNEPDLYMERRNTGGLKNSSVRTEKFVEPWPEVKPVVAAPVPEPPAETPVKKLDIQEVLSRGTGIKMSNTQSEAPKEKQQTQPEVVKKSLPQIEEKESDSLESITMQIAEKKRLAQEEINKKLESLRQRKGNKL
ncbi:MAG: hypothetical protein JNN11_04540 [Candidatus Doudnabacteria bacterium]|nr:hypothetical protein [Candidatus Doudnabacteria bacterium]